MAPRRVVLELDGGEEVVVAWHSYVLSVFMRRWN
jgi:hypothetical protein